MVPYIPEVEEPTIIAMVASDGEMTDAVLIPWIADIAEPAIAAEAAMNADDIKARGAMVIPDTAETTEFMHLYV